MDDLSDSSDVFIKLEPGDFSETDTVDQEPPRKKRTDWDHHNTSLLLKFWRRNLPTLRREKRHSKTMEEIREALCRYGVRKTSAEIKSKMKNLQSKYRTEKSRMKENPKYRTTWVFYNDMHSMLLNNPMSNDPLKTEDAEFANNVESNSNHSIVSVEPPDAPKSLKDERPPTPPTPPAPKRPDGRKLISIHEDLLEEIRRANAVSERNDERVNELLYEANEIAKEQLRLTKEFLDKLVQ
ncbi:uncharacterized protein LOC132258814 [Phlebotomus argentipes]|uniref:uncharacterized protein LOC132258814 n=1 Tax=Phlebotomus argentipes TaxID=94469 RepID=UPI0028932BD8|nr:uncharacterized protein LOC132258814 [Phlebotomus argentipes]